MKKLLLCSVLAAFACISAAQAGEDKACADKAKTCPAQAKVCSEAAKTCSEKAKAADCSACCSKKGVTKKADSTAKGASQLIAKR